MGIEDNSKLAYGVSEAATALGLGYNTILGYLNDGTLRGFRIGKRRLILANELRRFVAQRERDD